jgi:hypothetical protein
MNDFESAEFVLRSAGLVDHRWSELWKTREDVTGSVEFLKADLNRDAAFILRGHCAGEGVADGPF